MSRDFSYLRLYALRPLIRFAVGYFLNLLRAILAVAVLGNLVAAVLLLLLIMASGDGQPVTASSHPAFEAIRYVIASVTGQPDYSGDFEGLGKIFVAYLAPYLLVYSLVVSGLEWLLRRRLFLSVWLSYRNLLILLLCLYVSFALISLRGSVSPQEFPYLVRFAIFGFMYMGSATNVMLVCGAEFLIGKALQHYLKAPLPIISEST